MRFKIHPDQESASPSAAAIFADLVRRKPNCVLGLAVCSPPLMLYAELIRLYRATGLDNARFFGDDASVPRRAITMGVGSILEPRQCLLLAFGKIKARPSCDAIEGPITAQGTASALQLHSVTIALGRHRAWDVIVLLDPQSAGLWQRTEYCLDVERSEEMLAAGRLGELGIGNK